MAGLAVLVFLHPMVFVVAWLLAVGTTLEMALHDLIGPAAFQTTIAVEKAGGSPWRQSAPGAGGRGSIR